MKSWCRRIAVSTAILLTLLMAGAVALFVLFPANLAASQVSAYRDQAPPEDLRTPAGRALYALTGPNAGHALAVLPADFSHRIGYLPTLHDGLPGKPDGGCSTKGVPLPDKFVRFCAAHDYGFDLLRLAGYHGRPLGPWARLAVDASLVQHMRENCSDPACVAAATEANIGLRFNAWRQHDGVPVSENTGDVAASIFGRAWDTANAARMRISVQSILAMLILVAALAVSRRWPIRVVHIGGFAHPLAWSAAWLGRLRHMRLRAM